MLYTVAYPELSEGDSRFVAEFRQLHDVPYRDVVAAHFTLLFGCEELDERSYLEHVEAVASRTRRFDFSIRYAMLGADDLDDTAYVFLVPDEGYSDVSLLHDELYRGPMAPFHRLEFPYIPHINVGTLQDRAEAKRLCDDLNAGGLTMEGAVTSITVGSLADGEFRNLRSFELL